MVLCNGPENRGAGSYSGQEGGEGGELCERGNQGPGGESRAARVNRAKEAFCHILLLYFFVTTSTIKTSQI